jgi:hypothetical protein
MVNFACKTVSSERRYPESIAMSQTVASPAKFVSSRNGNSDLQMLTEVEKWMTTIREINREQQSEASARLDHLLTTVTK